MREMSILDHFSESKVFRLPTPTPCVSGQCVDRRPGEGVRCDQAVGRLLPTQKGVFVCLVDTPVYSVATRVRDPDTQDVEVTRDLDDLRCLPECG